MEDICYFDATELASCVRVKGLSPVEVAEAHEERIEAANPRLNAVATLGDDPMARAHEALQDSRRRRPPV